MVVVVVRGSLGTPVDSAAANRTRGWVSRAGDSMAAGRGDIGRSKSTRRRGLGRIAQRRSYLRTVVGLWFLGDANDAGVWSEWSCDRSCSILASLISVCLRARDIDTFVRM